MNRKRISDNLKSNKTCSINHSRRSFLLASGSAIILTSIPGLSSPLNAIQQHYPKKFIAFEDKLEQDKPILFRYPHDDIRCTSSLIKLGEQAGGGIGSDKDIVAFNNLCSHMGGVITGIYNSEHKVAGPCPIHLTTYDLTRHGMVVSGHATEALPQIMLEVEHGKIYASSVIGLIFSFHDNQIV